ncbi:GL22660 [Drosophila persimilis]|uniref:GL22660 n=1 Tax=Drosophila persimilis TaxID=7234 RepID=B4H046_DROPE|nr:GL22660 [Drosophila persimilis]
MHNIANYLMGVPQLIIVLLIALHILYHLLHAGWLQSLQNLRLDRNLKGLSAAPQDAVSPAKENSISWRASTSG